jgi:flagellar biosynthetic protein FlhB
MSEGGEDDSEKTEEPTQKRLDDAREKGQVVKVQELNHWFMILAGTLVVMVFGPGMASDLSRIMTAFIERPHLLATDPAALQSMMFDLMVVAGSAVLLPLALCAVAAIGSAFIQHGWIVSAEGLMPKFEKISPFAGFKRLFSMKSLMEFLKGLLKLAIVGTVVGVLVMPEFRNLDTMIGLEPGAMLGHLYDATLHILFGVLATLTVVAALDWLYQRFSHMKELRMSRQDLKDEFKQTEGDPHIKQRLRQLRMDRSRKRMMAAVPTADVVIMNPTHFAVALKYDPANMPAPLCVAKGVDEVALRIRDLAKTSKVAVVENPPLARALYATVELDAEVPPEHYRAVAEVIGYVFKLRGRGGR